jgi:myo-inositol 2-dehydrogenase/D-chiro-inositol 1-dehydrogenase
MKKNAKGVGLAIIGAGRVGLFRGEAAARHPAVEWIGIAELNHNRGGDVAGALAPISSPPITARCWRGRK